MKNAMRGFLGVGLLVLAAWVLGDDLAQAAQSPGGTPSGIAGWVTEIPGPILSEAIDNPKITVTKLVNCQGEVSYHLAGYFMSLNDLGSRVKNLQAKYQRAKAYWDKMSAAGAKPGGTLNESVEPVKPIWEVLGSDMKKSKAENMWSKAREWAVYRIGIGDTLQYHVAYAHSDAFAKALARADYAKLSNTRLRSGGEKAAGELPPPTVEKLTEALSRHDANAELRRLVKAASVATSAEYKRH